MLQEMLHAYQSNYVLRDSLILTGIWDYEYLCLLRAITSEDGMTADFYQFKKSFIQEISNKIENSIRGINRVVYDITSKPPSTIELE